MYFSKLLKMQKKVLKYWYGDIAQPGERSPHTREVTGSSPVVSIPKPLQLQGLLLCGICEKPRIYAGLQGSLQEITVTIAGSHILPVISPHTNHDKESNPLNMEVSMEKDKQEELNRKKSNEKFNSITQKVKPENQNQTHNVRSEAVEPKIRQV